MDAGKLLRKQAVARHDEEDARLAKQHHQHHRRQGAEGGKADEIADLLIADAAEHMGERLSRADEWFRAQRRQRRASVGKGGCTSPPDFPAHYPDRPAPTPATPPR